MDYINRLLNRSTNRPKTPPPVLESGNEAASPHTAEHEVKVRFAREFVDVTCSARENLISTSSQYSDAINTSYKSLDIPGIDDLVLACEGINLNDQSNHDSIKDDETFLSATDETTVNKDFTEELPQNDFKDAAEIKNEESAPLDRTHSKIDETQLVVEFPEQLADEMQISLENVSSSHDETRIVHDRSNTAIDQTQFTHDHFQSALENTQSTQCYLQAELQSIEASNSKEISAESSIETCKANRQDSVPNNEANDLSKVTESLQETTDTKDNSKNVYSEFVSCDSTSNFVDYALAQSNSENLNLDLTRDILSNKSEFKLEKTHENIVEISEKISDLETSFDKILIPETSLDKISNSQTSLDKVLNPETSLDKILNPETTLEKILSTVPSTITLSETIDFPSLPSISDISSVEKDNTAEINNINSLAINTKTETSRCLSPVENIDELTIPSSCKIINSSLVKEKEFEIVETQQPISVNICDVSNTVTDDAKDDVTNVSNVTSTVSPKSPTAQDRTRKHDLVQNLNVKNHVESSNNVSNEVSNSSIGKYTETNHLGENFHVTSCHELNDHVVSSNEVSNEVLNPSARKNTDQNDFGHNLRATNQVESSNEVLNEISNSSARTSTEKNDLEQDLKAIDRVDSTNEAFEELLNSSSRKSTGKNDLGPNLKVINRVDSTNEAFNELLNSSARKSAEKNDLVQNLRVTNYVESLNEVQVSPEVNTDVLAVDETHVLSGEKEINIEALAIEHKTDIIDEIEPVVIAEKENSSGENLQLDDTVTLENTSINLLSTEDEQYTEFKPRRQSTTLAFNNDQRCFEELQQAAEAVANDIKSAAEEESECFCTATSEIFQDPTSFDFLLARSGSNHASRLRAESLYVRFDPLVSNTSMLPEGNEVSPREEKKEKDHSPPPRHIGTPKNSPALAALDRLICYSPFSTRADSKLQKVEEKKEQPVQESKPDPTFTVDVNAYKELELVRATVLQLEEELERQRKEHEIELEKQKNSFTEKINKLQAQLTQEIKSKNQMTIVIEEYEKSISRLVTESERDRTTSEQEKAKLQEELDAANHHLSNTEAAFNDVHLKYERIKGVVAAYKSNETVLKESIDENAETIKTLEARYEQLKSHAMSQLEKANSDLDVMRKQHAAEKVKLQALIKKAELKSNSLAEQVEQKTKENKELTQILDEVIARVGRQNSE